MMGRKKRTDDEVSFQITPMIDMTFLLLIFFMVTSKLSKEQIKQSIRLPVASAATIPTDLSNRDIINIDGDGQYFIANSPVNKGELKAYLIERFRANPPLRLYLRADRDTQYKKTQELMRMASEAGAVEVIFGSTQR
ncbi:biopolymer transporter ExbD [soil metagenome]